MFYEKALCAAERTLISRSTLAELKQASKDLRALIPDSALADLADAKIEYIESRQRRSST
ncbi:MAG TPA: hypothetical protein VEZ24_16060 [Microvirga sp.]|nr:hypothetical protein [Microvirga sp.]